MPRRGVNELARFLHERRATADLEETYVSVLPPPPRASPRPIIRFLDQ
jgi:hypothetical protein